MLDLDILDHNYRTRKLVTLMQNIENDQWNVSCSQNPENCKIKFSAEYIDVDYEFSQSLNSERYLSESLRFEGACRYNGEKAAFYGLRVEYIKEDEDEEILKLLYKFGYDIDSSTEKQLLYECRKVLESDKLFNVYREAADAVHTQQIPSESCQYRNSEDGLSIHDFVIRTTKSKCAGKGHHLEKITAVMKILTQSGIKDIDVPALYCKECDEYYINEQTYNSIKHKGTLCHRVVTENEYLKVRKNYNSWNDKSILSSYGYNVNAQDDLSDQERHDIIAFVIENNICTSEEILSFLEWLVRKRGYRFPDAANKWERDIEFTKEYIPEGGKFKVGEIYYKKSIPPGEY